MTEERFNAQYYSKYYGAPETRVTAVGETERLVSFVSAYIQYLGLPVKRILDMGCGMGLWRAPLSRAFPKARYIGVEVSHHICETLGFTQGSIVDYQGRGQFDFIVCQGVLQYLSGPDCSRAIANLARLCRGVLYLEVLSQEDWDFNCDQDVTDGDVHLRSATSYREALRPHFQALGGGLFVAHSAPVTLYELEKPA